MICCGKRIPARPAENRDYVPGDHNKGKYILPKGFPQGANISPFLSIVQLAMGRPAQFAQLLMYADDGVFYSDNEFTGEQVEQYMSQLGLSVAPDKSGWVKRHNT